MSSSETAIGGGEERSLAAALGKLEIVVCCGSGGVGKTTVSAALAAAIACNDSKRVLVVTVDPARRLARALGMSGIGADPVPVSAARLRRAGLHARGELWVAMLDQKSGWDRMVERYAPNRQVARRILGNRFYQGISDAFVGSHEYMAMEFSTSSTRRVSTTAWSSTRHRRAALSISWKPRRGSPTSSARDSSPGWRAPPDSVSEP